MNSDRFSEILKGIKGCACGKDHLVPLKKIILEKGAVNKLDGLIKFIGDFNSVAMICDENTYKVLGARVEELCLVKNTACLDPNHLHATEKAVEEARKGIKECDLLLAVGSGTVHDITRYIAHDMGIPFISVPTAPSVDGFVSNVAAMTLEGVKITTPATCPIAVCADTDILASSPRRLIASGFADLLGKYTALADWKITTLITGEYICDKVIDLEYQVIDELMENIDGINNRETDAIENLMYGLILSGMAIQMVGYSRPASGSEHHVSHFIEMNVVNEENDALHGEKVGVGLVMVCDLYHKIMALDDLESRITDNNQLPVDKINAMFKDIAPGILKENAKNPLESVTRDMMISKLPEIREIISQLPTGEKMREVLESVGCPSSLAHIGLSEELKDTILYYAAFARSRLTFMRFAHMIDMG